MYYYLNNFYYQFDGNFDKAHIESFQLHSKLFEFDLYINTNLIIHFCYQILNVSQNYENNLKYQEKNNLPSFVTLVVALLYKLIFPATNENYG